MTDTHDEDPWREIARDLFTNTTAAQRADQAAADEAEAAQTEQAALKAGLINSAPVVEAQGRSPERPQRNSPIHELFHPDPDVPFGAKYPGLYN